MINCPWVGRLKLAASVRERPLTMGSLTRSRNSYAVSSKILRTNESNLRNYLFNKIFVRNSTYMHFPIPSFEQEKNLRKILKNVGNSDFENSFSGLNQRKCSIVKYYFFCSWEFDLGECGTSLIWKTKFYKFCGKSSICEGHAWRK